MNLLNRLQKLYHGEKESITRRAFNVLYRRFGRERVLFVGVSKDNKKEINEMKRWKAEVWTIDKDSERAQYGNGKYHIIGDIKNASKYFKKNYFDTILMLGVIGYGLNNKKDIKKTFKELWPLLKNKSGTIILSVSNNVSLEGDEK